MPRPSRYSPAEKAALLNAARIQLRNGTSRKDIAINLGIHPTSLSSWLREQALNLIYPPVPPSMPRNRSARRAAQ